MLRRAPHSAFLSSLAAFAAALAFGATDASAQLGGFPANAYGSSSSSSSGAGSSSFGGIFGGYASGKASHDFPKRYSAGQIVVSFGDRRLYHVVARGRAVSYPISVPRSQSRWSGVHRVSRKAVNPTWTPTPLMRRENPKLPGSVPGGHPRNPLGVRALYLGSTMYRIHGTDAPWSIGKAVSKGCIRMHNAHVVDLYNKVRVGTKVTTTWNRYRS